MQEQDNTRAAKLAVIANALYAATAREAAKRGVKVRLDPPRDLRRKRAAPAPDSQKVYFMRQGDFGPIKIGWTTTTMKRRLHTLKVASPWPLVVLLVIPGDRALESSLHEKFSHLRLRGEWFLPAPELMNEIERLGSGQ